MPINRRMSDAQVHAYFQKIPPQFHDVILFNLSYVGELCVNLARSTNTYIDQTGNLRNSIGYVIVHNGKVIKSGFTRSATVKGSGKKASKGSFSGVRTGEDLANQLAAGYDSGYALIVVAGMNYAASVESRGLDVLTSAEQLAESVVPTILRQLKVEFEKR
ncbi:hypothetical protein EXU85_20360 [Spirosoma sp. KCTC 42546]|uniref:hypothetical protein n=1 Tax=Spirosoma sp. KCTC 42546 TaxID=2520506 RepID=UPI001158B6AE|nr:hypothetical protein [Spirosoma sp. KCTC 42546]QDK80833.1 hypothetical protein EXU85_20360 [Spirosoma sp. KCTC 42546]